MKTCEPKIICPMDLKASETDESHGLNVTYSRLYHNDTGSFAIPGSMAHFECTDTKMQVNGPEMRTCLKSGEWRGDEPRGCVSVPEKEGPARRPSPTNKPPPPLTRQTNETKIVDDHDVSDYDMDTATKLMPYIKSNDLDMKMMVLGNGTEGDSGQLAFSRGTIAGVSVLLALLCITGIFYVWNKLYHYSSTDLL